MWRRRRRRRLLPSRTKDAQFIIISLRNNMFELADRCGAAAGTGRCGARLGGGGGGRKVCPAPSLRHHALPPSHPFRPLCLVPPVSSGVLGGAAGRAGAGDRLVGIYKTHHCTKSVTINPAKLAAHIPAPVSTA